MHTPFAINNDAIAALIRDSYTPSDIDQLWELLECHNTLRFPPLASGVFSAVIANSHSATTSYLRAWVRDNVHVAHAHLVNGRPDVAVQVARTLCAFYTTYQQRLRRIIAEPSLARIPQQRPHIRFDGETLTELPEHWPHDQNDALGYFIWLFSNLAASGLFTPDSREIETLSLFPAYFRAIQYWQDRDAGHWEEAPRKVEASSVGTVVAGLRAMQRWVEGSSPSTPALAASISPDLLDDLIARGVSTLQATLPWESRDGDGGYTRRYDAALLFLVYPLELIHGAEAEAIVRDVVEHLSGSHGIKRYLGDSFYCADYETNLAGVGLTRDFTAEMSFRDQFLVPDGEAQWCIFDPVISTWYGTRFQATGAAADRQAQVHHFNRALGQISGDRDRFGPWLCPELYYREQGVIQTSKQSPLLWTQANLWTAFTAMRVSAALQ